MSCEELIKKEIGIAEGAYLYVQLCADAYFGQGLHDLGSPGVGRAREKCQNLLAALEREFARHIKGQPEMVHIPLLSLVLNEHALLEGLPGVGKTEMIKWIAHVTGLPLQRVQFIPDMLPSDLIGRDRIDPVALQKGGEGAVTWVNGPLFTSVLLADEINRAPSKVQAALLEAMGENQVTPFGKPSRVVLSPIHEAAFHVWWSLAPYGKKDDGHPRGLLGLPAIPPDRKDLAQFTTFATMNPIEQEGTYPLSEAQIDRFCFKVVVPYPRREVYGDITDVVYSGKKPPEALEPQCARAEYEEYFRNHWESMRPVLGPIYFFLLCRSFIRPIEIREPRRVVGKCMWDANRNTASIRKIYDLVLLTNAKSPFTDGMARRRPIYTEKEQVELRTHISSLAEADRNRLLSIFNSRHCQYVLAGASPRGFSYLLAAALCEAFVRGHDMVDDEHVLAVVYPVLRHRVHMDVHARLENIESVDVLDAVCDKILEAY